MEELLAHGRRIHPTITCEAKDFETFVMSRLARGASHSDIQARAAELYLVAACLRGDQAAIERLDAQFLVEMRRAISRIDADPAFVAKLQRRVREALLVGDGHPYLDEFTGQAPLAAWIRVFAIRTALETAAGSSIGGQAVVDHDPMLRELQRSNGAELAEHVRDALADLDMRQRTTLRMHLNDHASVDDIARLFRVHHTTVMGWLEQAMRHIRNHVIAHMSSLVPPTVVVGPTPRASRSQILRLALSSTILAR